MENIHFMFCLFLCTKASLSLRQVFFPLFVSAQQVDFEAHPTAWILPVQQACL